MRRSAEILKVLTRHGFGDLVHELKLEGIVEKAISLVYEKPLASMTELPRPVRVRKVLEELGSSFVKLGQILSTRPDLVPVEWATEFRKLQNDCPPVPFSEIRQRLKEEFGANLRKYFRSIDSKPLAAASIAQVHRAVLKDGTPVVLKILRPGIEARVDADIAILSALAALTERHFRDLGYSPTELVREFERTIHLEMDLKNEAGTIEHFRAIFEDDEGILFPKIYRKFSTERVLAEEEIDGTLLSDPKAQRLPLGIRRSLVENGTRAVLCQCLEAGYFHADPHPSNLFALAKGRIAFIDCGQIGQLDDETMSLLADLVAGVIHGDVEAVCAALATLTDAEPEKADSPAFRADVRTILVQFENTSLGQINIARLLEQLFGTLRSHKLRCPANLVLLIKALATIESVGKELEPSFDFVAYAAPFVERLVERKYSFSALRERLQRSIREYANLAETFPRDLQQVLRQLKRNKITVNVEHRGLSRLTSTVEHASRNISFSLIIAAMLVGSSILVLSDRTPSGDGGTSRLGLVGFVVACLLLAGRVLLNRKFR